MSKTLMRAGGVTRQFRQHDHNPVPTADAAAAEHLCDEHAAALFSLAVALTEDHQRSEAVVVKVLGAAFPLSETCTGSDLRRELARRVYLLCTAADADTDQAASAKAHIPGRHARSDVPLMNDQQRTALALAHFGSLTYRDVAELLELPVEAAAHLLRTGLLGLPATAS